MSDHLTNARTCVTHASKARDAGSAISWLTDACKQIIAYLESQQAPPAAQQGDGGPWTPDTEDVEFCLDYLEAQNTTGATMTYTPTTDEVRRLRAMEQRVRELHHPVECHNKTYSDIPLEEQ